MSGSNGTPLSRDDNMSDAPESLAGGPKRSLEEVPQQVEVVHSPPQETEHRKISIGNTSVSEHSTSSGGERRRLSASLLSPPRQSPGDSDNSQGNDVLASPEQASYVIRPPLPSLTDEVR